MIDEGSSSVTPHAPPYLICKLLAEFAYGLQLFAVSLCSGHALPGVLLPERHHGGRRIGAACVAGGMGLGRLRCGRLRLAVVALAAVLSLVCQCVSTSDA